MSIMSNLDVRRLIDEKRLHHYEVAKEMGVSVPYFSRLMQTELSEENKKRVLDAISRIEV